MSKYPRSMFVAGLTAAAVIFYGAFVMAENDKENAQSKTEGAAQSAPAADSGAAPGNQPGGPGQGVPPGMRFDPSRMQEMMVDRLRDRLGGSEEEWNKIKPALSDVVRLRMEQRGRGFGRIGRRGPGGPGGPGAAAPSTSPEADALSMAVENESTPDSELQSKLAAYRDAQKKKEQELKDAREKLRKDLTPRQEAKLVLEGILD